jgi:hypothetical protein
MTPAAYRDLTSFYFRQRVADDDMSRAAHANRLGGEPLHLTLGQLRQYWRWARAQAAAIRGDEA